jgi:hypothetical protein
MVAQKEGAFLCEKKHGRIIRTIPCTFTDESSRFELLQSLLGRLLPAVEIESCGMRGSHDAGLKEASEQRKVAVLNVYGIKLRFRR